MVRLLANHDTASAQRIAQIVALTDIEESGTGWRDGLELDEVLTVAAAADRQEDEERAAAEDDGVIFNSRAPIKNQTKNHPRFSQINPLFLSFFSLHFYSIFCF